MTVSDTTRESVRALLDGEITRRTFLSRLVASGIAAPAASSILSSLMPARAAADTPVQSRRLHNVSGGELMAEFLRDWEVPYIFGLGGSEEVGFLDTLVDRIDLQYVLALHEGSAMSMADGYARSVGKPAFVNLHSVVGASYALGPMVNAYKDRTPLVVTVGRQGTDIRGSEAFLEAANLHTLPRDFSRWTWDVLRSDGIADILRRAFLTARVPPRGPVFLTFSKDLWEQNVSEAEILPPARSPVENELQPDASAVTAVVDQLIKSESPLIIAGRELSLYGGINELTQIAELIGAPVMADVPASHSPASFPTTHPHYAGLFALEKDYPKKFDLFWSVGGTMFTLFKNPPRPLVAPEVTTIHASIDGTQIGRNHPVDIALTGNVSSAMKNVLAELQQRDLPKRRIETRREQITSHHESWRKKLQAQAKKVWNQTPIAPERLAMELNKRLAPDTIVVTETATSDFFLWRYMDFHQANPGRKHVTSAGGCLGWGIGAAIGTKIGQPDRPVALMVGDGSFQFGVQALWSAARYEVPVAIIIWNNTAYQANRRALHRYGGRAADTGKYIGCYLGSPKIDNIKIANGYGIEGETVTKPEKLAGAIDRCLKIVKSGRTYILDVAIQPRFPGADSVWYDSFSIARGQARKS
jgi:thiamine pyrophosphate-dependent acetolactate synthase large subunit-like protein